MLPPLGHDYAIFVPALLMKIKWIHGWAMPPFYRRIVESRVEVAGAHRTGSVRLIGSETEKWGKAIKFAGIKAD